MSPSQHMSSPGTGRQPRTAEKVVDETACTFRHRRRVRAFEQIAGAWRFALAAIPVAALTIALPLVNRVDPKIAGIPFVLCWIVAWALAAPVFLWIVGRIEKRW